ncbi:MAG: STAS domain-containing protein [candidate division Zixibacteria bacterium]|nr:STAS domain-containing protein [Candidatus Tariuqbacter arcticus]
MEISITELEPGIVQISLSGRFDAEGVALIRGQFQSVNVNEGELIIVEMSGVDMLASSGIRLLLAKAKTAMANSGKVVIAAAQPQVQYPMTVSGVDTVLPIYSTVEKALSATI